MAIFVVLRHLRGVSSRLPVLLVNFIVCSEMFFVIQASCRQKIRTCLIVGLGTVLTVIEPCKRNT